MDFEFKKLSDVNSIEAMKEGLNVLVEDGGEIVKLPVDSMMPQNELPAFSSEDSRKSLYVDPDGNLEWAGNWPHYMIRIMDMNSMVPGMLQCDYSAEELEYYLGHGARIQRVIVGLDSNDTRIYYSIGEHIVTEKNDAGEKIGYIRYIEFPGGLGDIVVDVINNTITMGVA